MKILLDTTYLFPLIKISIEGIDNKTVKRVFTDNNLEIMISEVSLLELIAKGAKYVNKNELDSEDVMEGVRAIKFSRKMKVISYLDDENIIEDAIKIKRYINDFIDCIILASAINHADILLTEDSIIHKIKEDRSFWDIYRDKKSKLKIFSIKQFTKWLNRV